MASEALRRFPVPQSVAAATAGASFLLVGNAITQSWSTVPSLLVDFPTLGHPDHAHRATLLGHQWPLVWRAGGNFFWPIGALGILGHGFAAWAASKGSLRGDWRIYAVAAACHLSSAVHTWFTMIPLNDHLDSLRFAQDKTKAVQWARDWMRQNRWRIVLPLVAGTAAVGQMFLL
ncbi:hypothetical protein MBLNU457_6706t1 [Dothideomycetes sp. NU457]